MKNIYLKTTSILFLITLSSLSLQAQNAGQFLLNGDVSFFNNRDKSDRTVPERTTSGELIPEIDYAFQQYASNLTFNPRLHYFLNEKWSVGVAMGFRQVITRRFVDEIEISAASEYIAFTTPSKVQSTIYSYSPKIEVARHWKLNDRFSINLTGVANWRWVSVTIEETESLALTRVDELSSWSVSQDGLKFTPENPETEEEITKQQYWALSVVPQLRYAVNSHFGFTAAFGGIELTQKVKDDAENFLKSAPTWSIRANPNTWTLGIYGLFGGGEE